MYKYIKYAFATASLVFASTSCSDFGDVNIDPEHMNEGNVPYEMLFTNAQHQGLGSDWDVWRNGCIYCGQWMQHIASIYNWWTYSFYRWNDGYSAAYWDIYAGDRGAVRDITTVMDLWATENGYEVDYNMARIMRVYIMHRMTDLYGDVPYSQAGRPAEFSYPIYDTQESIYKDMLKELNEAQANLQGAGTAKMGAHDVYFQGDAEKWRKFANSLMLRLAMRMSKVDPTSAKEWVNTAISNGLLESIADNVKLDHPEGVTTDDSSEPYAKIFAHEARGEFFLSDVFVNMLKESDDPRLALVGTVCEDPTISHQAGSSFQYGNSDPAIQKGLPCGYSNDPTNDWFIGRDYPEFNDDKYLDEYESKYSTVNRYTYSNPTSHTYLVTYAQQQLLLAEAAVRGWISGNAKSYYEEGVQAAMKQFSQYTNATSLYNQYITTEAINKYFEKNPFNESKALEQINTQYWITCFCDEYESFANWRRSGYPQLTPTYDPANPYPECATEGSIPRRFRYPTTESQVNTDNYNEAVSRLNQGDTFSSRVWWDKE